ncbi:hypothetical protein BS47DRAFT_1361428 [Hydnum rufescens UP504]|uniref:Uncharacterized protein n=1 Tax=Hydnum rufescens UP504 TaxID=1448309 RepID=A0A9P6DV22_9AGAM|nr:hypothetical protein BS47DRAFT_1361428 [Hydnum rufescens UP504]
MPNDTADIMPHRTTPASAGVVLHKVSYRLKYIQQDEDPPNEPPPPQMTTPRKTKATNAPRQRTNAKQTQERGRTTQDHGTPRQTTHPLWRVNESMPNNPPTHLSPVRKPDRGRHTTATQNNAGTRMNHTSATAGVWFYTRYRLTTNTKMKTRQRNPPPRNDNAPTTWKPTTRPTKMSAERNPLNRGVKPGQTTHPLPRVCPPQQTPGTSPNDQPNVSMDGTTPTQAGRYHTPTHAVLNMQMGNQKARLGRPQIYV